MNLPDDHTAPRPAPLHFVTLRDRIIYLRSLPDFEGVPMDSIAGLAQLLEEERVSEGTTLIAAGDAITNAYFLVEGVVGLYKDGERVGELVPPQAVAAIGVLARISGPPGDIVADEDCLLLCMNGATLRRRLEEDFELFSNTMRSITRLILGQRRGLPFDPAKPPSLAPGVWPERPLDFVDRFRWFADSMPLQDTSLDAMGELARQYKEVRVDAGTRLWELGDQSDHFFAIVAGVVEVENGSGKGRVGAGNTIGFFDTIGGLPRGSTATAVTDLVGLHATAAQLFDVLEDQPELAMALLGLQAQVAVDHLWNSRFLMGPN